MTKPNPAAKLAEEIIEQLRPDTGMDWRHKQVERIEGHLQPTFDLLQRIHRLARDSNRRTSFPTRVVLEIEQLTREHDNET